MDESTVRESAETHAHATVERDYEVAGSYLTDDVKATVSDVMRAMPRSLTSAEILDVDASASPATCRIRYAGDEGATTVESRWEEVGGRPMIVALDVVEKG
jgi:hypothetical protein